MLDMSLPGNVQSFYPAVTLTWTQVVPQSQSRRSLALANTTANIIYVSYDPAASGTNGIPLAAGQTLLLSAELHGQLARNPLWAITVTAPGTLVVFAEEPV
jgi:hypothetical protein